MVSSAPGSCVAANQGAFSYEILRRVTLASPVGTGPLIPCVLVSVVASGPLFHISTGAAGQSMLEPCTTTSPALEYGVVFPPKLTGSVYCLNGCLEDLYFLQAASSRRHSERVDCLTLLLRLSL